MIVLLLLLLLPILNFVFLLRYRIHALFYSVSSNSRSVFISFFFRFLFISFVLLFYYYICITSWTVSFICFYFLSSSFLLNQKKKLFYFRCSSVLHWYRFSFIYVIHLILKFESFLLHFNFFFFFFFLFIFEFTFLF